jgi:hypothetical protein
VNIDWASGLGGGKEGGPSLVAKAANEKDFGLFGTMLKDRRAEADVFLKGIPAG